MVEIIAESVEMPPYQDRIYQKCIDKGVKDTSKTGWIVYKGDAHTVVENSDDL